MTRAWPFLLLLAGCASTPAADRPKAVVVRLQEDAEQVDLNRPIVARLFGEERRSLGGMMEELVTEELERRGQEVQPCPAEGATPEELAKILCEAAGADGIVWIRMGRWDLDSVTSGSLVTVEYEITLHRTSDAGVAWAWRVPSRTVHLQAGEQRDIRGFIHRLVIEALRGFP